MTITTFSRGFCTGFMRVMSTSVLSTCLLMDLFMYCRIVIIIEIHQKGEIIRACIYKRKDVLTNCCKKSIHATALATFAETVGELGLLSSLSDDKDEVSLSSLELEVITVTIFKPHSKKYCVSIV